jgi:hypothetical protein
LEQRSGGDQAGRVGIRTTASPAVQLHAIDSAIFNNASAGQVGYVSTWAGFVHKDRMTAGKHPVLQSSSDQTLINSSSGQQTEVLINNAAEMWLTTDAFVVDTGLHVKLGLVADAGFPFITTRPMLVGSSLFPRK